MFYVGQPKVIGPLIGTRGDAVAATVVGGVDQETANEMTACDKMTASGQKRKFGSVVRFALESGHLLGQRLRLL